MKKSSIALLSIFATVAAAAAAGAGIAVARNNGVTMPWDKQPDTTASYGIMRNEDGEFVRTGAAKGMKAGINGERNDFNKVGPWSKVKTVEVNGNTMVRFHKWYQNADGSAISLTKLDHTWTVPAAFLDKNGKEKDYFDYSAFAVNVDSKDKATAVEGDLPKVGLSLDEYREYAANAKGHVATYAEYSAIFQLAAIEFGTTNLSTVFKGIQASEQVDVDITMQKKGETNTIYVEDKGILQAGMPFQLIEKTNQGSYPVEKTIIAGTIKSITRKNVDFASSASSGEEQEEDERKVYVIKLDCDEIDVRAKLNKEQDDGFQGEFAIFSATYVNGYVNGHGKGTSRVTDRHTNPDNDNKSRFRQSFSYRGIENFYGGYPQYLEGITAVTDGNGGLNVLVSKDPSKFANATIGTNLNPTEIDGYDFLMNTPASKVGSQWFWGAIKLKDGYIIPDVDKSIEADGATELPEDALGEGASCFNAGNPVTSFITGTSFIDPAVVYGPMGFRGDQTPTEVGYGIAVARLAY